MRSINDINRQMAMGQANPQPVGPVGPASVRGAHCAPRPMNAGDYQYSSQTASDFSRDVAAYHAAAKAKSGKKKIVLIVIIAVCAVLLSLGTAFALFVGGVSDSLNKGAKSDDELLAIEDALGGYSSNFSEPFYVLLLGSDARGGESMSRSDTNIVVRVDPVKDQLTMLSIPRDTKIEIEGHGTQKFNAAYAFGKVPGVIKAAEDLLDVEISHYAEVNFLDLKDLVDAVGGVTVDVETRIDDWHCDDGDGNHYVIEEGEQTLSGGEALTFARSRHYANGDFTRTSNQRKLVEAIINKVLAAPLTSIPGIVSAAAQCVTTDLKLMDIIGLAQQFADNSDITTYSAMLPSFTQNINGISFVINDEEKTAEMMELFRSGKDPSGIVSTKSASNISTKSIDTSETLVFADDDEAIAGSANVNTSGVTGGSTGNTGSTGSSTTGGESHSPASSQSSSAGGDTPTGNAGGAEGSETTGENAGNSGEISTGNEDPANSPSGSGSGVSEGSSGGESPSSKQV